MRVFSIIAFTLALFAVAGPLEAGQCLSDSREVSVADKPSKRVRDYFCRSDRGTDSGGLRVQFLRLTDLAFDALLSRKIPGGLSSQFGPIQLVETDTYGVYTTLISRFGERARSEREGTCAMLNLFAAGGGGETGESWRCEEFTYRTLGGWFRPSLEFPAPDLVGRLRLGQSGWRYLKRSDLLEYPARVSAHNRIVSNAIRRERWGVLALRNSAPPTYVKLLAEISKNGLPRDFIVLNSWYGEGCAAAPIASELFKRGLLVTVAVVTNTSTTPKRIDQLDIVVRGEDRLRSPAEDRRLPGRRRGALAASRTLAPGASLVVPMALDFAVTAFQDRLSREGPGFGRPDVMAYRYGPTAELEAMQADGERYALTGNSANFISVTLASEAGSCPYLYSWERATGAWISEGKVIHAAKGAEREGEETKRFKGLVNRFLLKEEEAEVAYMDFAGLKVFLKDGSILAVPSALDALNSRDGRRVSLLYGQEVEMRFDMPDWLDAEAVERSELTLRGYYRRYADVLAGLTPGQCPRRETD